MNIKEEFNQNSPSLYYFVILVLVVIFFSSFYFLLTKSLPVKTSPKVVNEVIPLPIISHESGLYNKSIDIEIRHPDDNAFIFYTLDGSNPSLNDMQYTKPLKINDLYFQSPNIEDIPTSPIWKMPSNDLPEGVVIKAAAFIPGKGMGKSITKNFLLSTKSEIPSGIPFMFLVVDNDKFFGNKNGIYVMGEEYYDKKLYKDNLLEGYQWWAFPANYFQRGAKWKVDGNIEYIDFATGNLFSSDVKVKIMGGVTRSYPQKSLSVSLTNDSNGFPFFQNRKGNSYKSLVLRNSGQDWRHALLRDGYYQKVLEGMNLDLQAYKPVILFLNGKFWGLHNLREHWSVENIALKYECNPEEVMLLEYTRGEFLVKEREDSTLENQEAKAQLKNLLDFINESKFAEDHNYKLLNEKIDIDNFIDYMIAQTFCANIDWPDINLKMFKVNKEGAHNKWRFIVHDVDLSLGNNGKKDLTSANAYRLNMFDHLFQKNEFISVLFMKLLENNSFTKDFFERYKYHFSHTFEQEKMLSTLNRTEEIITPFIPVHIKRWGYPKNIRKWHQEVDVIREFVRLRPDIVNSQLAELPDYLKNLNISQSEKTFTYQVK